MDTTIKNRFDSLNAFYRSGATRNIDFRIDALRRFEKSVRAHEEEIAQALWQDLHKSPEEAYVTETAIVLEEIRTQVRNIRKWARPQKKRSPLFMFPSSSRVIYEPKGVVFILAPWNYPLQLLFDPLAGAIAAGNCVALKPSTTSAATCTVMKKIVSEVFPENYVACFDGGHEQTAELLTMRFDHIFFTGGAAFGRTVMAEAAKNLVPVTLELGGKSPCIVDAGADTDIAARRIVWGKLANAGQTCIAPDYLFVHRSLKDELLVKMAASIERFYGKDPRQSPGYPRIVSDKAFARLNGYLQGPGRIVRGGQTDPDDRYIAPTFIEDPDVESPLMQEEIFGPILPVMAFDDIRTVVDFVNSREKPLAFYYFGKIRKAKEVLSRTTSGGACVNDTLLHVGNNRLPFGGVGMSGMGRYHGRYSFETFSNMRGTVFSKNSLDMAMRYPPYKKVKTLKKIM